MNRRLLPGLAVALIFGACSKGTPTETERSAAPAPALHGGVMHGSGNRADSTANTTAATLDEATAMEKESTGVMHGSGN